jgi:hypothetical protein
MASRHTGRRDLIDHMNIFLIYVNDPNFFRLLPEEMGRKWAAPNKEILTTVSANR